MTIHSVCDRRLAVLLFLLSLAPIAGAVEYVMDPDWPKPLPDDIEWGQVPNVFTGGGGDGMIIRKFIRQ